MPAEFKVFWPHWNINLSEETVISKAIKTKNMKIKEKNIMPLSPLHLSFIILNTVSKSSGALGWKKRCLDHQSITRLKRMFFNCLTICYSSLPGLRFSTSATRCHLRCSFCQSWPLFLKWWTCFVVSQNFHSASWFLWNLHKALLIYVFLNPASDSWQQIL